MNGYRGLEKAFEKEDDASLRGHYARLLALAPGAELQGARHVYAEYALQVSGKTLAPGERDRLRRILGDGLLDSARIDEAAPPFEAILAATDATPEDREYAAFKLGWVEMNRKRPQRAFALWKDWLDSHAAGNIRRFIVRDLGRAWSESLVSAVRKSSGTTEPAPSVVVPWPSDAEERVLLVQGVVAGALRAERPDLERLRLAARRQPEPFRAALLGEILRDGRLAGGDPCALSGWYGDPAIPLEAPEASPAMSACLARLAPADRVRAQDLHRGFSRLAAASEEQRLPRIRAAELAGDHSASCREWLAVARERQAQSPAGDGVARALHEAIGECRRTRPPSTRSSCS